jgi:hypothetical protein
MFFLKNKLAFIAFLVLFIYSSAFALGGLGDKDKFSTTTSTKAIDPVDLDNRPWSALVYAGTTSKQPLGQLIMGEYTSASETLYTAELAYMLNKENIIRKILSPLVSGIQIASNVTLREQHHKDLPLITELDLYVMFRWMHFPWNKHLVTTLAAGEGISYASSAPYVEIKGVTSDDSRHLLNYLVFEATFALPTHPEWQLVARIHHRSTAYGVFGNTNGGSNTVGLGIRYFFGI